jgi:hypothetical protein
LYSGCATEASVTALERPNRKVDRLLSVFKSQWPGRWGFFRSDGASRHYPVFRAVQLEVKYAAKPGTRLAL